jgi:phosphoglycolate phosphatase-like HAD superfamily hydrolase
MRNAEARFDPYTSSTELKDLEDAYRKAEAAYDALIPSRSGFSDEFFHDVMGNHNKPRRPIAVDIEGFGTVRGWDYPSWGDATPFEIRHNIDLVDPEEARNSPYSGYTSLARVLVERPGRERYVEPERFIFDFDDTLKDTGSSWVQAHREVLRSFGFSEEDTSDENILKLFGNIHVGQTLGLERFVLPDGTACTDDEVWVMIKTRAAELLASNMMDPLLVRTLRTLHEQGKPMAVWSSSPRELLEQAITANGLDGVFDAVVSVDDVEKHKPDPEGVFRAVYAMDIARGYLQPGEDYSDDKPLDMSGVWMMGDSPNDVKGGVAAGASTVWLEHPLQAFSARDKRSKELASAETTDRKREIARAFTPMLALRNFDITQLGYEATESINGTTLEDLAALPTDNSMIIDFLTDLNQRRKLFRREQARKSLVAQGFGDRLTELFPDDGAFTISDYDADNRPTREILVARLDLINAGIVYATANRLEGNPRPTYPLGPNS